MAPFRTKDGIARWQGILRGDICLLDAALAFQKGTEGPCHLAGRRGSRDRLPKSFVRPRPPGAPYRREGH